MSGSENADIPVWSPVEDMIAFVLDSGEYSGLVLMSLDSSTYELLFEADQVAPNASLGNLAWSANGQRLVFEAAYGADRHADTYICTISRDGTGFKQLMDFPHEEPYEKHNFYPHWSPDDRKIVFASNHRHEGWKEDYKYYLYTMNADGSNITPLGVEGLFAVWSPDGSQILYTNNGDLYVVDAEGGQPKQLTSGPVHIEAAIWVP
ncbi:MAG: DPP IV N-terminal domain-containing protein [candidate division WOR-3 bacterium]